MKPPKKGKIFFYFCLYPLRVRLTNVNYLNTNYIRQ